MEARETSAAHLHLMLFEKSNYQSLSNCQNLLPHGLLTRVHDSCEPMSNYHIRKRE